MSLPRPAVEAALSNALRTEVRIRTLRALNGGCINLAARMETSAGPFFIKYSEAQDARFSTEAKQLQALADSPTSLIVSRPIVSEDASPGRTGFLVAEYIDQGPPRPDLQEALGRGLAALHGATAQAFGFASDTYCGSTLQPNPWTVDWIEFYREHRLRHQLRLLTDAGKLSDTDMASFERVLVRLDQLLDATAPPSLIHGDLWSGNLLVTRTGDPALIDPAAYYAHREAEFGMTSLFGGFSERMYEAYEEVWPMEPEWRERRPLYQLWHVANHATLFGGSYIEETMGIVQRFS